MKKILIIFTVCAVLAVPAAVMAFPTVYPTGTTIYKPKKCDNGYTVYGTEVEGEGSVLIDMNGKVVKQWKNMSNREHPVKLLEGGYIMGATREKVEHVGRIWGHPESTDMSVMDWDGNIVWSFPKAGMHHDFQILGNPVGYWVPGMPLQVPKKGDKVLILSHKVVHSKKSKKISDKVLYDDYIAEIDYLRKSTMRGISSGIICAATILKKWGIQSRTKTPCTNSPTSVPPGPKGFLAGTGFISTAPPM